MRASYSLCISSEQDARTTKLYFCEIGMLPTNLLINAIRYTESRQIEMICEAVNYNQWKIIISDTGIGISEKYLSNIFNP